MMSDIEDLHTELIEIRRQLTSIDERTGAIGAANYRFAEAESSALAFVVLLIAGLLSLILWRVW
jgi:hypothetical protein